MAACGRMSDMTFNKLRLGKLIEIDFEADNEEYANEEIEKLCKKFLSMMSLKTLNLHYGAQRNEK